MIYPGYLLNPGDMFQVDPDSVMYATGAPKEADDRAATRRSRAFIAKKKEAPATSEADAEADAEAAVEQASKVEAEGEENAVSEEDKRKAHKFNLKALLEQARAVLSDPKDTPSAKRKQKLRAFRSQVRSTMSKVNVKSIEELDSELDTLVSQLSLTIEDPNAPVSKPARKSASESESTSEPASESASESDSKPAPKGREISDEERQLIKEAMKELRYNPIDPSKPYATPWRPRAFMPAFAFIPKYLEVNQNVCSAVYLRHPVAKPGLAEVPTPFHPDTNQLAFNWYLRRR
jgi:ribosomal protein S4